MKIELKSSTKNNDKDIFCNDEKIGWADLNYDTPGKYGLQIDDGKSHLFFEFNLDFLNKIDSTAIALPIDFKIFPDLQWASNESKLVISKDNDPYLYLRPDVLGWNKSVSIEVFVSELDSRSNFNPNIQSDGNDTLYPDDLSLAYNFTTLGGEKNIGVLYNNSLELFNQATKEIFKEVDHSKNHNSLTNYFKFPSEIKPACEQYLIYFATFLSDLGINASTEIKSEKHHTLFTIIPDDSKEALSNIREALEVYLNVPNSNNLEIISGEYPDVSVKQLIANVYHLKSQLMLAGSTIQFKEATIESLKMTNYNLKMLLEKTNKKENKEEFLGGLASVDLFEWKGIQINLGEILRRLKRKKH